MHVSVEDKSSHDVFILNAGICSSSSHSDVVKMMVMMAVTHHDRAEHVY